MSDRLEIDVSWLVLEGDAPVEHGDSKLGVVHGETSRLSDLGWCRWVIVVSGTIITRSRVGGPAIVTRNRIGRPAIVASPAGSGRRFSAPTAAFFVRVNLWEDDPKFQPR